MFGDPVPLKIEKALEKEGLSIYSAGISPAKGGPVLNLGACFYHQKLGYEPLTEEESRDVRKNIKARLLRLEYKSKSKHFVYHDFEDFNDFKIRVLLKETDVDQKWYKELCRAHAKAKTAGPIVLGPTVEKLSDI